MQACINGWRSPFQWSDLPHGPAAIALEAAAAVAAGATAIHVHPKSHEGSDTLDGIAVAEVLTAIRSVAGAVPIGVTTGLWATYGDRLAREELVGQWTELPDFASVNWHEPGSPALAELLLSRGVGVEAGLHSADAVAAWGRWPHRDATARAVLEVVDPTSEADGVGAARGLVEAHRMLRTPVPALLHSEDVACWAVLRFAVEQGLDARIGLEDTFVLPDGSPASGNGPLVRAALGGA